MKYTDKTVYVKISGLTGTGKSIVYTEIATALSSIGLKIQHENPKDAATEMRMNGHDQLEMYDPRIVMSEHNISPKQLKTGNRRLFRLWRGLTGRDNCEVCPGLSGVRGNENIVDGIVMCDYCHAKVLS